jgi:Chemotaxis signal transduction protein
MVKRISLREFQAHLASRLAGAMEQRAAEFLGVQSGEDLWLLNLSDSGEIIPFTPLTSVPLTKPWFVGVANIRGRLYSVTDFSAFQGKEVTLQNANAHLLLIGTRYGSNAALLITRILGLRNADDLTPIAIDQTAPNWVRGAYSDKEGKCWKVMDVRRLLADESFMDINV